jgi:hypothetical protein
MVSDYQEWDHLEAVENFCEIAAELYSGQNNTAIQTYIGELEHLGYSSALSLFLGEVLYVYDSETDDSESDTDISIELGGDSSEVDMADGEESRNYCILTTFCPVGESAQQLMEKRPKL